MRRMMSSWTSTIAKLGLKRRRKYNRQPDVYRLSMRRRPQLESLEERAMLAIDAAGLVAYWNMDEPVSWPALLDATGRTNPGIFESGTRTSSDGVLDRALDLDGVDDFVDIGSAGSFLVGNTEFAIAGWVKATGVAGEQQTIIGVNTSTGDNRWMLFLGRIGSNTDVLNIHDESVGGWISPGPAPAVVGDGEWHHFAVSRLGNEISLYVDGALEKQYTTSLSFEVSFLSSDIWSIGQEYDPGLVKSDWLDGSVDEFRLYDRALSSTEIAQLASARFDSGGPIVVSSLEDENDGNYGDGDLSLREAIAIANVLDGPNIIEFNTSLFMAGPATITLGTEGPLEVITDLTIVGPGADELSIDRDGTTGRIFQINQYVTASISGLTISGGDVTSHGGGIYNVGDLELNGVHVSDNHSGQNGGGIFNGGQLFVINSTFANNTATHGGGIVNYSQLSLINSTVDLNTATHGGGIYSDMGADDELLVLNSTVSNNSATGTGGGVSVAASTTGLPVNIINSTISGNSAAWTAGVRGKTYAEINIVNSTITKNSATVYSNSTAGGIGGVDNTVFTLNSTIVADNTATMSGSEDVWRQHSWTVDLANSAHNLIGVAGNSGFVNNTNENQVGSTIEPLDPGLAPLGDYGGPTRTHALLMGSLAVDAGNPSAVAGQGGVPDFDQRGAGFSRVVDGINGGGARIDIGAVEFESIPVLDTQAEAVGTSSADTIVVTDTQVSINGELYDVSAASVIVVYAGGGNDQVDASAATKPVRIFGESGVDTITGGAGDDHLDGGDGNDFVYGGLGDDYVFGGAGNDELEGNDGNDRIEGGAGSDNLAGGTWFTAPVIFPGQIQVDGAGEDTFVYSGSESLGIDYIFETPSGESDTLDFSKLDYGIGVDVNLGSDEVTLNHNGESLYVDLTYAHFRIENAIGTKYDDTFTDSKAVATSTLTGGLGNDTYVFTRGGISNNQLVYGGHDTIIEYPGEGNDTLDFSGLFVLSFYGGVHVDLSSAGVQQTIPSHPNPFVLEFPRASGLENIIGTAKADVLTGNANDNYLAGGLGDDTYKFVGTVEQGKDTIYDAVGQGTDTIDFSGLDLGEGISFDLRETGSNYEVIDADGDKVVLDLSGADLENVTGTIWDDILIGDSGNNVISGGAGNDYLQGREGTDTLNGGTGNDIYNLIAGQTTSTDIVTDADGYSIQFPNSTTSSRPFIELAKPVELDGQIVGTPIGPIVIATISDIETDLEDLTISVTGVDASDIAVDLDTGEIIWSPDVDEIGASYQIAISVTDLESLTNSKTLNATVVESDGSGIGFTPQLLDDGNGNLFVYATDSDDVITVDETSVTIETVGSSPVAFDISSATSVSIIAGNGNDIVTVDSQVGDSVTIYGAAGDDILTGGSGNDVLFGGDGNDTLAGGAGDDALYGGVGVDVYDGGTGTDVADDPDIPDIDTDGLPNVDETNVGTDATDPDTDGDGLTDGFEVDNDKPGNQLDPTNPDTDDDDVTDGEEDPDGDGATNVEEQMGGTDPNNSNSVPAGDPGTWRTYGEASIAGNVLTVGQIGDTEGGTQPSGFHGASIALAPATSYTFTFDLSLASWDSYNNIYDSGGGTGFWDSFSISVTSLPYDTLQLTNDPLQFPFVWGGSRWGDQVLATYSDNELTLTFPGDGQNTKYLNLVLDSGNPPEADNLYPSWGTFSLPAFVDLDILDEVGGELSELLEDTPGAFVAWNDNDDDEDEVPDRLDDLVVGGDDDLLPLKLHKLPFVGYTGEFVLAFSSGLRVWHDQQKSSPVASGGTAFSISADTVVYVEGYTPSTSPGDQFVRLDYNESSEVIKSDRVTLTVVRTDLAIDSNNDDVINAADDAIEDIFGDDAYPGKVIAVSNTDSDGDGLLDWADGFDWVANFADDDASANTSFVPLNVTLPDYVNLDDVEIQFTYSASDPADFPMDVPFDSPYARPTDGIFRIWTKDSSQARSRFDLSTGGDFVGTERYLASNLDFDGHSLTLYVEAINPSIETADQVVAIQVFYAGNAGFETVIEDRVRITASLIEIIANAESPEEEPFETYGFVPSPLPKIDPSTGEPLVNSFKQTYTVNVYDPRAGFTSITIEGQDVPLIWNGSHYTTDPIIAIRSSDESILLADQPVELQYDFLREHRYVGYFLPDDPNANPIPWNVSLGGTSPTVSADIDAGILSVDTTGGQKTYSVAIDDPNLWFPSEDTHVEISLKLVSHDTTFGANGAFSLLFGDGSREWRIGLLPDRLVTFENGIRIETMLSANLLDGNFHALGFQRTGGASFGTIWIDGVLITSSDGQASSHYGIQWGDVGTGISGSFLIDYVDWEYPAIAAAPVYVERPSDIVGSATVILIGEGTAPLLEYNPQQQGVVDVFLQEARGADKTVAKFVDEVVEELKSEGWTASNPADSGAFGKEVHSRVAAKINQQWFGRSKRWLTNVLVYTGPTTAEKSYGEIVAFNASGGQIDHTEIDVIYLAEDYKPKKGDILDSTKITVYEVKSSASGAIPDGQLARLKNLQGGDIRRVQTSVKWKQLTNELVPNKRYNRQVAALRKLGRAIALVGGIVALTQADEAFAEFEQELDQLATVNDPTDRALQKTVVFDKFKNYVNAATGGVADGTMNAVFVGYVYGVLLPQLADPNSEWNQGE